MDFEYEIRLKDGRLVNVTGEADIIHACDCGGDGHDHIEAIDIDSAIEIVNDGRDEWLEIDRSGRIAAELESKIEAKLYAELEGVA